jgi:hypothetical protein
MPSTVMGARLSAQAGPAPATQSSAAPTMTAMMRCALKRRDRAAAKPQERE